MKTQKKITIMEYELPIEIRPEKEGYVAFCPKWKDCYAQGDTIEEVISEITKVAITLIEICKEENIQIPLKLIDKKNINPYFLNFNFPLIVSSG